MLLSINKNKMKGDNLGQLMREAGLSQNEAKVLAELYIGGEIRMRELAKRVDLKRVTVYAVVNSLVEKELAGIIKKGKIQFAFAKHPDNITNLIKAKKRAVEENYRNWESFFPDVLSVFNQSRKMPGVQFLEGMSGLQKIYDQVLAEKKEVLLIRSRYDNDHPELYQMVREHKLKKARRKIKTRVITPIRVSKQRYEFEEKDRARLVTRCMVPRSKFTLESQVMIFGNYVALTAMKDDIFTTVINNDSINQTFRVMFDYIWEMSWPWHQELLKKWKKASKI